MIVLRLGKSFKLLIKEKYGFDDHIEIPDKLRPSIFEEETNFVDSATMLILKSNYLTYDRQLRDEFL
jgi:hypothetical protein